MNIKLEQYLYKRFPSFFLDDAQDVNSFTIDCGDGWFQIIYWACIYIEQKNKYSSNKCDFKFLQIKEKFSKLRIYATNEDNEIRNILDFSEVISGFICEKTGKTNDIARNTMGWIKTYNIDEFGDRKTKFVYDDELREIINSINQQKSLEDRR